MGSEPTDIRFPIRFSSTKANNIHKTSDLHRYWRNHAIDGYLERYWPGELDDEAWIRSIRAILAQKFPHFANSEIKYFAAGTFNRLYSISGKDWVNTYIFRVSIPVEPFYKTESEVATMEYIRQHSTIPVPRVYAFSSSDANELGFEWILLEMINGIPIREAWSKMSEAARFALFTELAEHTKGLLQLRFSELGNIYFSDVADQVNAIHQPLTSLTNRDMPKMNGEMSKANGETSKTNGEMRKTNGEIHKSNGDVQKMNREMHKTNGTIPKTNGEANKPNGTKDMSNFNVDIGPNKRFIIGRIVAQDFFFDKRIHYPVSRGPFRTTRELIDTRMELLGRRIQDLTTTPGEPYYCEIDLAVARNKHLVQAVFEQFKALVPHLVPVDNGPEDACVLFHDDISQHNLLVDPVTFKLASVVDWESVNIMPAYEVNGGIPIYLTDRDFRPTPLFELDRGTPPNDEWLAAKAREREAEYGPVRRKVLEVIGPIFDIPSPEVQRRVKAKQELARQLDIENFERRPWATAAWMAKNGLAGKGKGVVADNNNNNNNNDVGTNGTQTTA